MKSTVFTLVLALPAVAFAQQPASTSSSSTSANASARASAQASVDVPTTYSAEARAKIRAAFDRARERNLPDDQMRSRLAEAQAKGAADAQTAAAVQKAETRLEASQSL